MFKQSASSFQKNILMKLNLKMPIVFFDLETTGLDTAKSRIVEISYIKVHPNGNEESATLRINPECHIPEECTAVHGIADEDVKDCPTFKQVAAKLAQEFKGCNFAGFNSNRFDVPLLVEEMLRAGIDFDISKRKFVDVQNIYHKLERRTLIAAYKYYCGKDLTNAHSADADTRATYEVLQAQLDHYPEVLENDIDFLAEYSTITLNVDYAGRLVYKDKNKKEEEILINFGKYKGKSLKEVLKRDPGYYAWIMDADFSQNTKQVFTKLRLKYAL